MRHIISALGLLAASAFSASADISWDINRIAPGSVLTLQGNDGSVYTHLRQPAANGQAKFDTFASDRAGGAFVGSYTTNARGEITQLTTSSGETRQFLPHRCMRTIGTCKYTIRYEDGFQENRIRVTKETGKGFTYKEYGQAGLLTSGATVLDKMGSTKSGWTKNHATGKKQKIRQLRAVYQ